MLISGPAEWSAALLATGVKANLLHDGYNPELQVSAMPLGPTVAITRYADAEATPGFARGVLDQPAGSLLLHEDASKTETSTPCYRLVSWSRGSAEKCLLAIASTIHVEVWEVTVASDISAVLKGSVDIHHLQGLAWNPCSDNLLIVSKTDVQLINASQPTLSRRTIYTDSSTRHAFGACSWSPCGLQLSLAQNHILHCFGWTSVSASLTNPPRHNQIDASSSLNGSNGLRLDIGMGSVGPIAAVSRLSPTICILTTDTKVILEDISRASSGISTLNSEIRKTIGTRSTSSLLLGSESTQHLTIREEAEESSSGIINLMSMRVSSSSARSSLQILNHVEDTISQENAPHEKPRSHVVIVEYKAGQWGVISILDLPHLTSPDILIVQDMRAIIGSSLSSRLLVAHLDVSDRMEWTVSLSGELELPSTHLCRGIYLAERSPFVDVASTEKCKRATFFHAGANLQPQPTFLSKFKVPRRSRPRSTAKPTEIVPAVTTDQTSKSSVDAVPSSSESKDLLELILVKMSAMQTQLNARFDDVDKELQQLTARVEHMERNVGTCAT
ncbi:hypothetical protein KRP22_000924 [Phytophthora ramorum]|nr:hypothetical protein KRP22_339 [Phytophthora ramorum]